MRKIFLSATILCVTMLVATSCSEKAKFQEFAIDFAHAVNSGDTLKIDTMLAQPQSYQFSQINLAKINPDSIQIDEAGEGKYKITSAGDVCMVIAKVGEKMVVEQTWKIFGGEPASVAFALKNNLIKDDDDDKTIYSALHSEQYAKLKEAELEEQKFAAEQEEAQKVIGSKLAEFAELVNTMQDIYNMDPAALLWSANQTVLTAADNDKRALDQQKKYMTSEQSEKYEKLVKQYNRLIHS